MSSMVLVDTWSSFARLYAEIPRGSKNSSCSIVPIVGVGIILESVFPFSPIGIFSFNGNLLSRHHRLLRRKIENRYATAGLSSLNTHYFVCLLVFPVYSMVVQE